jgi:hypothetical protein
MIFDDLLNLYANGSTPTPHGNGFMVACPICAGGLQLSKKPRGVTAMRCEGKQCPVADVLAFKNLTYDDLSANGNGAGPRAKKTAQTPPPPSQPPHSQQSAPPSPSSRPPKRQIDVSLDDMPALNKEAWGAIEEQNDPPILFIHGDGLIRTRYDFHDDTLIPDQLNADVMRHELSQMAEWIKTSTNAKTGARKMTVAKPPVFLVKDVLASRVIPLPRLHRVVSVPVFAPDGTLLTTPGYNKASGVIYAPPRGYKSLPVPDVITPAHLDAAKKLIEEVLQDFPFSANAAGDSADHNNAVALFLLPFARDLIDGPTPFHLIEASMPGSGKGLLASALLYPGLGKIIGESQPHEDDELRKLITTKIIECAPLIFLDNINHPIIAGEFAAALTMDLWGDRILGRSASANAKVRAIWLGTGNNVSMSTEITRRTVRIRLTPQTDRPEERTDFAHDDLMEFIEGHRPELVQAAHVIVKNAIQAGLPKPKSRVMASFIRYSRIIGSILECAGYTQFLANHRELQTGSDAEREALSMFAMTWYEWAKDNHKDLLTTSELLPIADNIDGIRLRGNTDKARQTALGFWLKNKHEVITEYLEDDPTKPIAVYKFKFLNMGAGRGKQRGSQVWKVELLETVER